MNNVEEYLTVSRALEILKPPLVFANPKQIAAVRFIEAVDTARDTANACEECEGRPVCGHYEHYICRCVYRFPNDVLGAAFNLKFDEAGEVLVEEAA
jgi:hypothetical protein